MWWHVYFIQSLIKLWRLLSWNLFCFYFHQKTCHCSIFSFISPVCEHPCIACRLHTVLSKIEKKSQRVGRLVWLFYFGKGKKKEVITEKNHNAWMKGKSFLYNTHIFAAKTNSNRTVYATHILKINEKSSLN